MGILRQISDLIQDLFGPLLEWLIFHWVVSLIIIFVLIYWAAGGKSKKVRN